MLAYEITLTRYEFDHLCRVARAGGPGALPRKERDESRPLVRRYVQALIETAERIDAEG